MVTQAGGDAQQLLIAEIDLARSEWVRRRWPFLRDRRIDAYADLARRFRDG
jgi:N-carbamoylputrescine amidase